MPQGGSAPSTVSSERFAKLAEQARALGRTDQADRFMLLAWAAFEGSEHTAWHSPGTVMARAATESGLT